VKSLERIGILGGVRIPFARQNTQYVTAGNLDMLTAVLAGVVQRFGLQGERLGEVAAGAVLKHTRDFNLTRDAALSSGLAPQTPAYDVQQACATSLETAILVGNKIAVGQIDAGIAGGVDSASDAPIAISERLRRLVLSLNRAKSTSARLSLLAQLRPSMLIPAVPNVNERRTGLSMGEHCEQMVRRWNIGREAQDELALSSHTKGVAAFDAAAALGAIDRARLNVNGGSVGLGHPFAATGARILGAAAKQLAEHRIQTGRRGRTLVSVCAAGGLGATAILESA
jgi:acetyl-CoA C-acetyltransferase